MKSQIKAVRIVKNKERTKILYYELLLVNLDTNQEFTVNYNVEYHPITDEVVSDAMQNLIEGFSSPLITTPESVRKGIIHAEFIKKEEGQKQVLNASAPLVVSGAPVDGIKLIRDGNEIILKKGEKAAVGDVFVRGVVNGDSWGVKPNTYPRYEITPEQITGAVENLKALVAIKKAEQELKDLGVTVGSPTQVKARPSAPVAPVVNEQEKQQLSPLAETVANETGDLPD